MSNVQQPLSADEKNLTLLDEGKGKSARRLIRSGEWELSLWNGDDEPRIRDIDLAERLGFEQPRMIRKLIKRNFLEKERPYCRSTMERQPTGPKGGGTREYTVDEYWLTEVEALFVATLSRTPRAVAITKEMIRVFVAVRRGLLAQPLTEKEILRLLFEHCLAPEFRKHETRFPVEFFKAVFFARGVQWPKGLERGVPIGYPWLGNIIADIIYYRLPGGRELLAELRRRNPRNEKGERRHRAHSGLTPEMAKNLDQHIQFATMCMEGFRGRWNDFMVFWDTARPERGVTTAWLPVGLAPTLPPTLPPARARRRTASASRGLNDQRQ